jgi:hypothetical protein
MVLDSYQRGNQLREQCGGRSSKFFIGTCKVAHPTNPYLNFTWDHVQVKLTYTHDQIILSPTMGMRSYKTISFSSQSLATELFSNRRLIPIPISNELCFVGAHVSAYEKAICTRQNIISIQNCLSHGAYNILLNKNVLQRFEEYTSQPTAMAFIREVNEFQSAAVKERNQFCDNVTLSYNMGVVGVRGDSSDGAAAVILDMLLKFGVLMYKQDETWALHHFAKLRRLYCFGDRKTVENSLAFVTKLSNHNLSFEESSLQAEIFLDAFNRVMFLPGDWHAGLTMLQAFYKLFWSDLLKQFRDLLQWQHISKYVWGCYFQASLLVQYSNNVISSYHICLYLSWNEECYKVRMNEDKLANVLCQIAVNFEIFL